MNHVPIMGNQRQVLKDNIEKELVTKIETAKDVITQMNKNLELSKQNSLSAKEEIRCTTEAMKEILAARKKDLIKEVENVHNVQARSFQDAMRSAYITMGKLQSMLANLDSFDQSQLVQLQIPQVNMSNSVNESTQISVTLECNQLKEDLSEWGNVTTDGFQCYPLEKTPISSLNKTCAPTPVPEGQKLSPCANKENKNGSSKDPAVCATCPWSNWGIEDWLTGSSSRKMSAATSKDEFLVVSSPCSESSDMDFVVPSLELEALNQTGSQAYEEGDSGSSIVCIEKDTQSDCSEMSVWLKPRKLTAHNNNGPSVKHNEAILSSDPSCFLSSRKRSVAPPSGKRSLDFPCLRMETENWVRDKKKVKSVVCPSDKPNVAVASQGKLIPPNYALPNPFWLKKYQHKR